MRTIVHISDIHFGRVDYVLVEPLISLIHEIRPDLVAISGDLTQRARPKQFIEAREFLQRLPQPQLVVPGNHDVPLFNLYARFRSPLANYCRHITEDLQPFHIDGEIAVAGLNTARSMTRKGGRVRAEQVDNVVARLGSLSQDLIKIVVSHHPFDLPPGHDERDLVGHAHLGMEALSKSGADLFLSGHLHLSHISQTSKRYKIDGHSALVVQAGTTISNRGRGEANAFNVIRIERPRISVHRYEWQAPRGTFVEQSIEHFLHSPGGWTRLATDEGAGAGGQS